MHAHSEPFEPLALTASSFLLANASSIQLPSQERAPYPWPDRDGDKAAKSSWYQEFQSVKDFVGQSVKRRRRQRQGWTWLDHAAAVLPCIGWLRTYRVREQLLFDCLAGMAVALTIVPQSMSYASIVGLPAVYGLYGSFTPLLAYSMLGTCPQLGVGPVAVTSMLIASGLAGAVPGFSQISDHNNVPPELQDAQNSYNVLAIQLAFLVAVLYTAIGVLRLGWIIRFIGHPVIAGFTSGAALTIAAGQLSYIFGVTMAKSVTLMGEVEALISALAQKGVVWQELVMGVCMIILLVSARILSAKFPRLLFLKPFAPFLATVIGIVVVVTTGSGSGNGPIRIVNKIASGMPPITINQWVPITNPGLLLPLAVMVMAVDLLESTSIARSLAQKNRYQLDFNQEITALGVANFFGAAFSAYTTTGSFSRSAINDSCGAKTQLSGFITGILVLLVLLFLTPVFRLMPYNVMAAIIIVGALQLVEVDTAIELFKVHVRDFLVWAVALLCTCLLGVDIGLAAAIGLSVILIIFESAFPHTAQLGRLRKTAAYRSLENFPNSEVIPGILVLRMDAPLYFANSLHFEEAVNESLEDANEVSKQGGVIGVRFVVFEMNATSHIDSQGAHTIMEIARSLRARGVQLLLSNPNRQVALVLDRIRVDREVPRDHVFGRCYDAVAYARTCLAELVDLERQSLVHIPETDSPEDGRSIEDDDGSSSGDSVGPPAGNLIPARQPSITCVTIMPSAAADVGGS